MVPILVAALLLQAPAPRPSAPYTTPLTLAEMTGKQAVVNDTAGTFVIDLRPDLAPNHVGYFIKLARDGRLQRDDLSPRDPARHHPGRRSAVEGSGEGEAVWHRRARRAEARAERREARRAARWRRCCSPGKPGQRRRRSSSSASPISRRSTASTRSSAASPRAWTSCRRSPRRRGRRRACRPSASRSRSVDDSRHAAARAGAVRDRERRRSSRSIAPCSRRPPGAITIEFFPRQGAGARPQLPAAGAGRRLRRHGVSPRRAGLRRCRPAR